MTATEPAARRTAMAVVAAVLHLVRGSLVEWAPKSLLAGVLWTAAQALDASR